MMNGIMSGLSRSVRGLACTGIAMVVAMTAVSSAHAQVSAPSSGNGTSGNPYQISNVNNLAWMGANAGSSSGKYYTVMKDIDATATTNWNSGNGFRPIGTNDTPFMGTFNGNSKVISNLYISRPSENYVGLFGYVGTPGVVKGIGLSGGQVTGDHSVGSLVGRNGGMVSNCYATGPVVGDAEVGGLVGENNGTVLGCYATGTVAGMAHVGGLAGDNDGGATLSRCYATGAVTGNTYYVGGLVGWNINGATVSNCYAAGSVMGEDEVGGLVGENRATVSRSYAAGAVTATALVGGLAGGQFGGTVNDSFWDTNTTGLAVSLGGTGTNTAAMKQQATFAGWDFVNVWQITEVETYPFLKTEAVAPAGSGLPGDPYQISQLGNLVWMGANVGFSSGKVYTVQNDIDAAVTESWNGGAGFSPIGNAGTNFMGVFNGNGKVINGLRIHRPSQDGVGIFGCVGSSGVVKDLDLTGGAVTGNNYVGSVVGRNIHGTVSGCYVTGSVTGRGAVGGLVGINEGGTVRWCYATVSVTGTNEVGGLVGEQFSSGTMSECCAMGAVMGVENVGGFAGISANGTVSRCYATGSVKGGDNTGGLVGYNFYSTVSNGYATGPVSGSKYVGGLVGYNYFGGVSNCYATGSVTGSYMVGGLVGDNDGTVDKCYAAGAVTGPTHVGGLVGYNWRMVTNSYWDTNTTGLEISAGGTGTNTAAMKQQVTFVGWDFTNVWQITNNVTYPLLRDPLLTPPMVLLQQGDGGQAGIWTLGTNGIPTAYAKVTGPMPGWILRSLDGDRVLLQKGDGGQAGIWTLSPGGAVASWKQIKSNMAGLILVSLDGDRVLIQMGAGGRSGFWTIEEQSDHWLAVLWTKISDPKPGWLLRAMD